MEVPVSLVYRAVLMLTIAGYFSVSNPVIAQSLDSLTVQTQRDRERLKHDVNEFVASAIVKSHNDETFERWTYAAVCPLVAGLHKDQGEFVLAQLSQVANTARAPLGGRQCKPNFVVVITPNPESILKKWIEHPQRFNYETGNALKHFVEDPRPVRVWYNVGATSIDGAALVSEVLDTSSIHAKKFANANGPEPLVNRMPSQYGSRLNRSTITRDILSVIIIVDSEKVAAFNLGQLSDYIALVGLAQIDLDKDLADAPTILSLFRASENTRPKELTVWDKALLHALYNTPQKNQMQLSEMQSAALSEIASHLGAL